MICPHCRSENPDKNKVCRFCGQSLQIGNQSVVNNKPPTTSDLNEKLPTPLWLKVLSFLGVILIGAGIALETTTIPKFLLGILIILGFILLIIFFVVQAVRAARKRFWGVAAILLFVGLYYAVPMITPFIRVGHFIAIMKDVEQAYNNKDGNKVLTYAQRAIAFADTDEGRGIAEYWISVGYLQNGDIDQAKPHANRALKLLPIDSLLRTDMNEVVNSTTTTKELKLNDLYFQIEQANYAGDFQTALTAAQQVAVIDPDSAEAEHYLGWTYNNLEQYAEAEQHLKKAIELGSLYKYPHHQLGITYRETGRPVLAEQEFKTAIDLDPHYVNALNSLADFYYDQKKWSQALPNYLQVIKDAPTDSWAWFRVGTVYNYLEDYQDAETYLHKAIEIDPNYSSAYVNLGVVAQNQNQLDDAKVYYQKAIDLDPKNSIAHFNLGFVLAALKDYAGAVAQLKVYQELMPQGTPVQELIDIYQKEIK